MISVNNLQKKQIPQVAEIHKKVLSSGFIATLPVNFLEKFYCALLESQETFTLVATNNLKVLGFVTCTTAPKNLPKLLLMHLWKEIIFEILKNPLLFFKFSGSLFYPNFTGKKRICEILSIAVIQDARGHGLGTKLVSKAKLEFKRRGFKYFQLSVRDSMKEANNFYQKIGLAKIKSAKFLGDKINFWQGNC